MGSSFRFSPSEVNLVNRWEFSKPKRLHECQSYRQFSLETYDPVVGGGANAIAFWWDNPSVRITGHYEDLSPKEAWEDMTHSDELQVFGSGWTAPNSRH